MPPELAKDLLAIQEWVVEFVETNKTYHVFLVLSAVYVLFQLPEIIRNVMGDDV